VHEIAAQDAAQRHEWHALLARLERGVHRRASRVADHDLAFLRRFAEARREAGFAERNRARLHFAHTPRADQEIGAQAEHRDTEKLQIFSFLKDKSPHDCHSGHGVVRWQRDERAVRNERGQRISREVFIHYGENRLHR
jgi:hypothetical protein